VINYAPFKVVAYPVHPLNAIPVIFACIDACGEDTGGGMISSCRSVEIRLDSNVEPKTLPFDQDIQRSTAGMKGISKVCEASLLQQKQRRQHLSLHILYADLRRQTTQQMSPMLKLKQPTMQTRFVLVCLADCNDQVN
jgi:hypothetical protein